MLAQAIRELFGYNRWAMSRVIDTATELTPEQFVAPGAAGLGSVRDTLLHAIAAQRNWVAFGDGTLFTDASASRPLEPAEFPDLASLRAVWQEVDAKTERFVNGLSDEDAARVLSGKNADGTEWSMPLRKAMFHAIVHCTQHRSEVAVTLTSLGHSPGNLDLLFLPETPVQ
jgi:uncharacterized damage-inducible protein DinB